MTKQPTNQTPVKTKTTTKKPDKTRRKNPIPNAKQFTSDYQPDPKNVSKGIQKRNARLRLQKNIEQTFSEMMDTSKGVRLVSEDNIAKITALYGDNSMVYDVIFSKYLARIIDSNTDIRTVKELSESLIKMGYGDKMTVDTKVEVGPTLAEAIAMSESRLNIDNKDL